MKKKLFAVFFNVLFLFCLAGMANATLMPTESGPLDIPIQNFANNVVGSSLSSTAAIFNPFTSGPFTTAQAIPYVIGSDLTQGLSLGQGPTGGIPDYIVPGFGSVSIVNGAGNDLAIWEAGRPPENLYVGISTDGGITFSALQLMSNMTVTNPLDSSSGFDTNIGYVNLDDFGVAAGTYIDAIWLQGWLTGVGGSGPDILAIAALNAGPRTGNVDPVPEPTTMLLLGTGLVGVAGAARKKKKNQA